MTINDQTSRGTENTSTDRVGKVFVALDQGMRKCLICDCVFTPQGARACWRGLLFPRPGSFSKEMNIKVKPTRE